MNADDSALRLDATHHPEFDAYRWVDFWYPVEHVVSFKRRVYAAALQHLSPLAEPWVGAGARPPPQVQQLTTRVKPHRPTPLPRPWGAGWAAF